MNLTNSIKRLIENGDQDAFDFVANLNTFESRLYILNNYKVKFTHNRSIKICLGLQPIHINLAFITRKILFSFYKLIHYLFIIM